jgi:hypothetical protein
MTPRVSQLLTRARGLMPLSPGIFYPMSAVIGIAAIVPFYADHVMASRIKSFASTLVLDP